MRRLSAVDRGEVMSGKSILALIPARGGSKGIPRKNIVDLCGRPLIAWSIEVARTLLDLGSIRRAIVTTDDEEIAAIARRCGGDVPFLRPAEMASDTARSLDYVLHALDWLAERGEHFEAVLLLQPTSPQRDATAIANAIDAFLAQEKAQSLISCYQEDYISSLVMYEDNGSGYLHPRSPQHNKGVRRQEHGPTLVRNGAVYITRTNYIRETGQLVCDNPMLMRMSKLHSIDLDTPDDLKLLRAVLCGSAY